MNYRLVCLAHSILNALVTIVIIWNCLLSNTSVSGQRRRVPTTPGVFFVDTSTDSPDLGFVPVATTTTTTRRTTTATVGTSTFPVNPVPAPSPDDKQLRLCITVENSPSLFYYYKRVAAAVDMGVERANSQALLNNYKIAPYYKDFGKTCTKKNDAVKYALEMFTGGITCHAYLGPGCGYNADTLYNLAEYLQIAILACPAAGSCNGGDRDQYPLMTRTSFTHKDTSRLLFKFFSQNGYKHVVALMDDSNSFYEQFAVTFTSELRKRPELSTTVLLKPIRSIDATPQTYVSILKSVNSTARVFLLCSNATVVRQIMLTAASLNMTDGNYVYIAIELFQSTTWGAFTWSMGTAQDRDAKSAFFSLLIISLNPQHTDYYDEFASDIRRLSRQNYNYTFGEFEDIDPVAISFYETVLIYADVINKILVSGGNIYDGKLISQLFRNATFSSPVSNKVLFDGSGDRQSDFVVKTMDYDTGRYMNFLAYYAATDQLVQTGPPVWNTPDGNLPPDVPKCGFMGEALVCNPQTLSGAVLGVAVALPIIAFILLGALAGFLIIRALKNEGLDPNWWRIQQSELDMGAATKGSQGSRIGSKKSLGNDDTTSQTTKNTDATSNYSVMKGRTATLRGNVVTVLDVSEKRRRPNPQMIRELNQVRVLTHQNLQRVLGVSVNDDGYVMYILGELCQKGSLSDLLEKDSLKLDWSFKNSLIKDIVMGMAYLHGSSVESHGNLTAHTGLVDSRFMLKVSDFGLTSFRDLSELLPPTEDQDDRNFDYLLWRAPELLRQQMPIKGTQKGDVYSFGILLQQIILRTGPFDTPGDATKAHQSAKEVILEIKKGTQPPFRPQVPPSACSSELFNLMERCWDEYPIERPTFSKIKEGLKKVIGNSGDNIIDHLLKRMEQYAADLEAQVAEKTEQFMEEKRRSEELLSQLLPKSVAESLTRGQNVDPELYDSVTIYFSDIVSFTTLSAAGTPMDVVSMLNNLYTMFDSILEKYDAYKVETIGDAYMLASGLPVRNGNRHAHQVALVSLNIKKDLDTFKIPHLPNDKLKLRIGLHSGTCVAGIVGLKMPRYCLFGDTVQIAQRLENSGEPMKIQVSQATKQLLEDVGGFQMQERDRTVEFKETEIRTWWLLSGK